MSQKEIRQWYLPSFRIRQIWDEFVLTKKIWDAWDCLEIEFPIEKEEFDLNWQIWQRASLEKTRFYLEMDWKTFEWDRFKWSLQPLCFVEVEFKTREEKETFIPPKWFWPEVTDDKRFNNSSLAKNWIDDAMMEIIERVRSTLKYFPPLETWLADWVHWIKTWCLKMLEMRKSDETILVNIAWWSSSWKTSQVTSVVKKELEEKWYKVTVLSMDNFYHGPTFMKLMEEAWTPINFDQPEAYNTQLLKQTLAKIRRQEEVRIPSYDFQSDPKHDAILLEKSDVVIVEWLFALDKELLENSWDLKAFVDVSSHGRVIRRLLRDAWENWRSGQTHNDVLNMILRDVESMDRKYVKPQKESTHIVISNDHNPKIESKNLPKASRQTKFLLPHSWIRKEILPWLESLWFIATWELVETDLYYTHEWRKLLETWEMVRLRYTNKDSWNPAIFSYKYLHAHENFRHEHHLSFEIDKEVEERMDNEYCCLWSINKVRLPLTKWDIRITIDLDVYAQLDWEDKPVLLGDFIEISWCKSEEEHEYYTDMVASLITRLPEDAIWKPYLEMMLEH